MIHCHSRYERNYRTLLRKVREHMKGRNVAEKHNGYLQELHNNLSDECNTLKLQLELKDSEISRIQSCVDNYLSINEKLKQNVLKLEKELADPCNRCAELDNLKRENIELCDSLRNCEKCKMKEEVIANLQAEVLFTKFYVFGILKFCVLEPRVVIGDIFTKCQL